MEQTDPSLFFGRQLPLCVDVVFKAKPNPALRLSPSPEGTLGPFIEPPQYGATHNAIWAELFRRQEELVRAHACAEYVEGRQRLRFPPNRVPYLRDVSAALEEASGWRIVLVSGFVEQRIFFQFLANRHFPCTDYIRHQDELEYTPAPDMFHDLMGHLPLITNQAYAEFFQAFGVAGTHARTEEELRWLARIYWFTVEFGLVNSTANPGMTREPSAARVYGAGLASSLGEILHAVSNDVEKKPFSVDAIAATEYDIHHMQPFYFEISSFAELRDEFIAWAKRNALLPENFAAGERSAEAKSNLQRLQQRLIAWDVKTDQNVSRLERVFSFDSYARALEFTQRVGEEAERRDHHPRLVLEWGKVTVSWWTHSAGGLTALDFEMAATTDGVFEALENPEPALRH